MIDIDKLEALAKAASDGVIRSDEWGGTVEMGDHLGKDEDFMKAASPATILALIAEVRALQEDKARLDSGCIVTHERDEFGEEYRCERRGNDLRAMIDAARREKA